MSNKAYYFDENFVYLGVGTLPLDPLETKRAKKPVYTQVDNATDKKPPEVKENEAARFNIGTDEWEVVKDYRGTVVFNKEGLSKVISELGPIPKGYEEPSEALLKEIEKNNNIPKVLRSSEFFDAIPLEEQMSLFANEEPCVKVWLNRLQTNRAFEMDEKNIETIETGLFYLFTEGILSEETVKRIQDIYGDGE